MAASTHCERACASSLAPLRALTSKLLSLVALSCALVIAGCAQSPPRASGAYRIRVAAPVQREARPLQREARPRPRPVDRALLASQAAPDCDFKAPQGESADPDVLARLKLDYERQCYRKAETSLRDRLRLVQTSLRRCEAERVRR
jgi:hypothetical protein